MNETFAIEPTAFEDVKDVKLILRNFGFHEGRFIASLPGKWLREVYSHLENFPDGLPKQQAKRLVETMKERGGLVASNYAYNPSVPWLTNAKSCEKSLSGIVVSPQTHVELRTERCRAIADIGDDKEFFGASRDARIEATLEGYIDAARYLLLASSEIYLIDPYFNFARKENTDVLEGFIKIGLSSKCKSFVIYADDNKSKPKGIDKILEVFGRRFPNTGISISARFIDQGNAVDEFHPRYLLSQSGALRFDKGFITEDGTRRDVAPIDLALHKDICRMYIEGKHEFTETARYTYEEDALTLL